MKEILITSSVLIAVLLLLRLVFAKKVSRVLIYGAWALVALRLLIPVQIGEIDFSILTSAKPVTEAITQIEQRPVSGQTKEEVYQDIVADYIEKDQTVFIPEVQEQIKQEISQGAVNREEIFDKIQQARPNQEIFVPEVQQQVQQQVEETADPITLGQIAAIVWLAGVAVMAAWFMIVNLRHSRMLRKNREKLDRDSPIPVYVSEKVGSPCLAGLFRPAIYLTPESAEDPTILRHVLTHELTHYAHKDHIWSVVRCVCLCVYWFDPLVWVAAWFSRRDCELACDEGALKRLGEDERIAYGKSLLDVVSQAAAPANLIQTATSMNETKKQLKERVNFIVKKQKISIIAAVCMVIVCAIVAGCAAAGPANGEKPGVDPKPSTPSSSDTTPSSSTTRPTDPTDPDDPMKWVYLVTQRSVNSYAQHDTYKQTFTYDGHWSLTGWVTEQENRISYEVEVDAQERTMKVYDAGILLEWYTYDRSGNLISEIDYASGGRTSSETKYSYTEDGKLLQVLDYRYDDDGEVRDIREEVRTYDQYGRLETKSVYSYLQEIPPEEEKERCRDYHYRYHYDDNGRLSRMDTYVDYLESGTEIDEYTLYVYSEAKRSVTENTYATCGNAISGYTQELDSVRIVHYDENGKVIYVEEYEMWDPDRKTITTYTYQAVQMPLDAFTPAYISLPEEHPNFLKGQTPEFSEEDWALYRQAVAALHQYENTHLITFTDKNGTYEGQDALWVICDLLIRMDDLEVLGKFRAEEILTKAIRNYSPTNSQEDLQTTEYTDYTYDIFGYITQLYNFGLYDGMWLGEDMYLRMQYGSYTHSNYKGIRGFAVYDKPGGTKIGSVSIYYEKDNTPMIDDDSPRIKDYVSLEIGYGEGFWIIYEYDDQGRISGWHTEPSDHETSSHDFAMQYSYDDQGRVSKTIFSRYILEEGQWVLTETVEDIYTYGAQNGDKTVERTMVSYADGEAYSQSKRTTAYTYNEKGQLVNRVTVWEPVRDMQGNLLGDPNYSREEISYYYEAFLIYDF